MLVKIILISFIYIHVNGAKLPYGKPFYDLEKAEELFEEFQLVHGKSYETDEEYNARFQIFVKNLQKINEYNLMHENTTFAINFMHDLTAEELSSFHGFNPDLIDKSKAVPVDLDEIEDIPETVDWRKSNDVTPVKYQGGCGSCWAFSAVAVMESQNAIKNKKLVSLSEQQLVDCDTKDGGCLGGDPLTAFQYAAKDGMMLEDDYSYVGHDESCKFSPSKVAVKVKGGKLLSSPTEAEMAKLVATYGPISIGFFFSSQMMAYSGGGVLTPTDCDSKRGNHAVAIVGYGTENGTPYWLIKNSYGTRYGDGGYLKFKRGQGLCLINSHVSIVEL